MEDMFAKLKGYEPEETFDFIPEEINGDKPMIEISANYLSNEMSMET